MPRRKSESSFDLKETLKGAQKKQSKKPKAPNHPVIEGYEKEVDEIIKIKKKVKELNASIGVHKVKLQEAALEHRVKTGQNGTVEFAGTDGETVQAQESEKFTDKITVDGEVDEMLYDMIGEDLYNEWFEIKRKITFAAETLKDEEKLTRIIKLIHENIGLDDLVVNQYIYPTADFSTNRYKKMDLNQQKEVDELIKTTRKIA